MLHGTLGPGVAVAAAVPHGGGVEEAPAPGLHQGADLGLVTPDMPHFAAYRAMLDRSIEGDFVRLHVPG